MYIFSAAAKCKVAFRQVIWLWIVLCLLPPLPQLEAQQDVLFGLDARFSQIVRFDPDMGSELGRFPSPVLCRPEGACGIAYSGQSLFMATARSALTIFFFLLIFLVPRRLVADGLDRTSVWAHLG